MKSVREKIRDSKKLRLEMINMQTKNTLVFEMRRRAMVDSIRIIVINQIIMEQLS